MDDSMDELQRWRSVRARVMRLEQENHRLRGWGRVSVGVNVLILVGALYWLAWPGRPLKTEQLTTDLVSADALLTRRPATSYTDLRSYGRSHDLVQLGDDGSASTHVDIEPNIAWLTMQNIDHGELVMDIWGTPRIAFQKDTAFRNPKHGDPQIELWLEGPSRSPKIMLRDANSQVIWHAP